MQNEPILGDIFRYSATGSSIKKPVFMRVCGHFEARRTIRHDPNDVAPKRKAVGSNPARDASKHAENLWLNSDKELIYLSTVS